MNFLGCSGNMGFPFVRILNPCVVAVTLKICPVFLLKAITHISDFRIAYNKSIVCLTSSALSWLFFRILRFNIQLDINQILEESKECEKITVMGHKDFCISSNVFFESFTVSIDRITNNTQSAWHILKLHSIIGSNCSMS